MIRILIIITIITAFLQCQTREVSDEVLFSRFIKQFQEVQLPIDSALIYRVHNNPMVQGRIDTLFVQKFINPEYQLKVNMPVYDGYAYAFLLPKEENIYESLIYYKSEGREQSFVLNTYTPEGTLLSTLPISEDSSSYKRITGQINESRLIVLREFILNQPDSISKEMIFEIEKDGTIIPQDTFIIKSENFGDFINN